MTLARWILRCYPKAWRLRYEEEMLDIATAEGTSVRFLLDLLAGAVDARLHPELVRSRAGESPAPIAHDDRTLLRSTYRQPARITFMGVLAWLGWTVVGGNAITALYGVLAVLDVVPWNDREAGAWNLFLWLRVVAPPIVGNLVIRRLVHVALRWSRVHAAR